MSLAPQHAASARVASPWNRTQGRHRAAGGVRTAGQSPAGAQRGAEPRTEAPEGDWPPDFGTMKVPVARFTIPGEPVAKERARTVTGRDGRKHTYTPEKTEQAEEVTGWEFRRACRSWGKADPDGRYAIIAIFSTAAPPSSGSGKDWDNLGKLTSDALNKLLWVDDCQVDEAHIYVRRGAPGGFSDITICRIMPAEGGETP